MKESITPQLDRIKQAMEPTNWDHMKAQAKAGDVEWASDMMEEVVEDIAKDSAFYLDGFHNIFEKLSKMELREAQGEWWRMYYTPEELKKGAKL